MNPALPIKWVKVNAWCAATGDTRNAVHQRRKNGHWIDDVHCRIGPDRRLWVHLENAEKWIEGKNTPPALR